jgi:hypothetical protein
MSCDMQERASHRKEGELRHTGKSWSAWSTGTLHVRFRRSLGMAGNLERARKQEEKEQEEDTRHTEVHQDTSTKKHRGAPEAARTRPQQGHTRATRGQRMTLTHDIDT